MPPKYFVPRSEFIDLSNTAIPKEVLNTGDPVIINNCLNTNKALTFNDQQVLKGRLDAMNFVNEMVAEQNNSKHQPPKAYQNENGWQLPALHQNHQTSANGCWAMPVQLMLQSRGIDVPQNAIRYYRPVISGPESAGMPEEQARELNTDTANNMARGAELLQRLLPNTMVLQSVYGSSELPLNDNTVSTYKAGLKKQVTGALSENGSPVALLIGGHYRTIVGIDGDDLIIKDSLNNPVVDERLSLDEVFEQAKQTDTQSVEISWLRDMDVEKGAVQTDGISELWPFIERKDDNLSIDPAVFDDLTAGENSRFSNYSYEDHGVFSNTLNVQLLRGRTGEYIRDSIIFPKTLTPNVKELEPIETYAPVLPEDPEAIVPDITNVHSINDTDDPDEEEMPEQEIEEKAEAEPAPEQIIPDEMYANFINNVDDDGPDEEEAPEQPIEENTEAKEEPELQTTENAEAKDEPELQTTENTEAKDEPELQTKENTEAKDEPELQTKENTEAKDEPEQKAKENAETKKEQPKTPAQEKDSAKKMSQEEPPKAAINAAPPLVKPEEKAPAEKAAPASTVKAPPQQPAKQPVQQPAPKQAPVQQPVSEQAPDLSTMLDSEISKYSVPSSSFKAKYVDVDMYPPKPSLLKELCKSFGSGLLGLVRGIPILGSIVGFFADVITNAVRSYDNLMEKLDAQRPFMAGEDVYNMAVLGAIKQGKKDPATAAVFADPRFQKSLRDLAENDPDLNYAATHNHSPEFYKKYLMDQKGFNKLSANYMKHVNKAIASWKDITKKHESNSLNKQKTKTKQAVNKQAKQQQQQNQPKINAPTV